MSFQAKYRRPPNRHTPKAFLALTRARRALVMQGKHGGPSPSDNIIDKWCRDQAVNDFGTAVRIGIILQ